MAKTFDFNKLEKPILKVTLKDGSTLRVSMPLKQLYERMDNFQKLVDGMDDKESVKEIDQVFADVLSCNLDKRTFTLEDVSDYEIEEEIALIQAVASLIAEKKNDPN